MKLTMTPAIGDLNVNGDGIYGWKSIFQIKKLCSKIKIPVTYYKDIKGLTPFEIENVDPRDIVGYVSKCNIRFIDWKFQLVVTFDTDKKDLETINSVEYDLKMPAHVGLRSNVTIRSNLQINVNKIISFDLVIDSRGLTRNGLMPKVI